RLFRSSPLRLLPYRQSPSPHRYSTQESHPHPMLAAAPHRPWLPTPPAQNFLFLRASEKDQLQTALLLRLPTCLKTGRRRIYPNPGTTVPSYPAPDHHLPKAALPESPF